MSPKAARARRDISEREIIDVLEARGFYVRPLAQASVPDLLVWRHDDPHIALIECKTGTRKLRTTQNWAAVGLTVTVLRSAEDAMRWRSVTLDDGPSAATLPTLWRLAARDDARRARGGTPKT